MTTARFKLLKGRCKAFLPVIYCILCIFLFMSLYVLHTTKERKTIATASSQVEALTTDLDKNFSTTLNTLAELSASKVSLDFISMETFDPVSLVDTYNLFAKSFKTTANLSSCIGIYNPKLDIVVSNIGTSPLGFILSQYHFNQSEAISTFINTPTDESTYSTMIFESDSEDYFLYLSKNNKLLESSITLAIFDIHYLAQALLPTQPMFSLHLSFDDTFSLEDEKIDFIKASSVLPITYYADFNISAFNSLGYRAIKVILLLLIVLSAATAVYLFYKQLKSLKNIQIKNIQEEQNLLLQKVIYGVKDMNIKRSLNNYGISILNDNFFMLLITHKTSSEEDSFIALEELEELLANTYSNTCFRIVMISKSIYIVFITDLTRTEIYDALKPLRTPLSHYHLILTDVLELNEVSPKFYEITQLLNSNVVLNRSNLILAEKIKIQAPVSYIVTDQDKKLLLYHLTTQNQSGFLDLIHTILHENLVTRTLSPEFYKQFIALACDQLHQLSNDFQDTNLILEDLLKIDDPALVKDYLYSLFKAYYLHLTEDSPKSDMQSKFLDYIHLNYKDDISLADMASHFNLAVNYVGVLFKEKTGYNFKDYLNTYRIAMAKEILADSPTMKIKDLSLEVGFININTFIRIFKKYESISPGQYQKYILDNLGTDK